MRNTFSINYQVRKTRVSKDGLSPIDTVIDADTERNRITTGKNNYT